MLCGAIEYRKKPIDPSYLKYENPKDAIRAAYTYPAEEQTLRTIRHCEGGLLICLDNECPPAIHVVSSPTSLTIGLWSGLFDLKKQPARYLLIICRNHHRIIRTRVARVFVYM